MVFKKSVSCWFLWCQRENAQTHTHTHTQINTCILPKSLWYANTELYPALTFEHLPSTTLSARCLSPDFLSFVCSSHFWPNQQEKCVCQTKTERPKEMFSLTLLSRSRMTTMNSTLCCHIAWLPYLSHAMTLSFFHLLKCWLIPSAAAQQKSCSVIWMFCVWDRAGGQTDAFQRDDFYFCIVFIIMRRNERGLTYNSTYLPFHCSFATVTIKADNTSAFLNGWLGWLWVTPKAIRRCSQNKMAAALYQRQVNQRFVTLVRDRKISWVVLK